MIHPPLVAEPTTTEEARNGIENSVDIPRISQHDFLLLFANCFAATSILLGHILVLFASQHDLIRMRYLKVRDF